MSKAEREIEIEALLAFAKNLEVTLQGVDQPHTLNTQLHKEIEKLHLLHNTPITGKKVDIDRQGTRLWNLASKLKHEKSKDTELLCSVRVFAYLFIDFAGRCMLNSATNEIRVLNTALKTTRYCLKEKQLARAEIVIERAAFYNQRLHKAPGYQKSLAKSLSIQYLIIRVALAWQQDRLDLAKLMLTKLNSTSDDIGLHSTEELSDLLFEIGKDLLTKSQWLDASFWLETAYDKLAAQRLEALSADARELRLTIMHSMVKSLVHQEGEDRRKRAWDLVHELSTEYRDKLIVHFLELDLLATDLNPSAEDYRDVLWKIVGSVPLIDPNINTILHHIHKLRAWQPTMAHAILFTFLKDRILAGRDQSWLEKILITIVWNCTTSKDFPDVTSTISDTLDIAIDPNKTITSTATYAAQVLLWRRAEAAYNLEMYEVAEAWCRLALHDIFRNSGSMNTGKLQRKLILCYLSMSNAMKAWEVVATMSEANKSDVLTQYLLYKVALRCEDTDMAAQCLNAVCSSSTKDKGLLYACVLEAQCIGNEGQIIAVLQRVLEQFDSSAPAGVHLPALLRCNARLLMRSVDNLTGDAIESLCKVFEGAVSQAKLLRRQEGDCLFSIDELDWFSRNCYNLSLRVCHIWPLDQTLRIVEAALRFIDMYPSNLDPAVLADLSLRRLFCDFVFCSICIHLARSDDNIESQLQHYLLARHSVSDWRSHRPHQELRLEDGALSDLTLKQNTLLAYDFEAAARLKSWEDFNKIIVEYQDCGDSMFFAILADIVLASEAPNEVIVHSLQQIINASWRIETIDIDKLSRWIRCLVSLALRSYASTAEEILDQAVSIAEKASTVNERRIQYPAEELEWLATTTFNRAIDFYCSSSDIECRRWAEKALIIGGLCKDGGLLHGILKGKFQALVWQER